MTDQKLPPEFKEEWVAALRSGKYKQGLFYLYDKKEDAYCCLGICALIAGATKEQLNNMSHESDIEKFDVPMALRFNDGFNETVTTLIRMNDIEMKSFLEIADYIEANL